MHGAFVHIDTFFDNSSKMRHHLVAVGQNSLESVIFGQIIFVQMILTRPFDDLVVNVGDVHDVENVVTEVVLKDPAITTSQNILKSRQQEL